MLSSSLAASRTIARPALAARPSVAAAGLRIRRAQRPSRLTMHADKAAVLSDVRGIIAEQLGKELDAVQQDSKFADLGADSLDTVEIMMALEEKFGFEMNEEGAENISTVQEAADLITQQLDAK